MDKNDQNKSSDQDNSGDKRQVKAKTGAWPRTTWLKRNIALTGVMCLILTLLMAASMIVNNWTLLVATSQISANRTYYCSVYMTNPPNASFDDYSRCSVVSSCYKHEGGLRCLKPYNVNHTIDEDQSGIKHMDLVLKRKWIWCLFCMLVTPDILTFFYSIWYVRKEWTDNKKKHQDIPDGDKKGIKWKDIVSAIVIMGLIGTLYVIGTCCFVFTLLPSLNIAVHGLLITAGFGLAPALFQLIGCCYSVNVEKSVQGDKQRDNQCCYRGRAPGDKKTSSSATLRPSTKVNEETPSSQHDENAEADEF